jgi:integrase/recombinase XerC
VQFQPFYTYLITEKRCSAHTLEAYKNDLEQFEVFCHSTYAIDNALEVKQTVVRSWLAHLLDEKYEVSSVHRKLSSLRAWFRFLLKTNQATENPVRGIPKPKKPKRLPVFVEESATVKIYGRKIDPTNFAMVREQLIMKLLYETGIRQSELLNLCDHDIDVSLRQIKVLGKRNKMRLVPIGKELLDEIHAYQSLRDNLFDKNETSHLLITDKGIKISKNFLYTTVTRYLSLVTTVRRKSPHILRHTFATHMLNNGADLNVIKEILGHSRSKPTTLLKNSRESTHGCTQEINNV